MIGNKRAKCVPFSFHVMAQIDCRIQWFISSFTQFRMRRFVLFLLVGFWAQTIMRMKARWINSNVNWVSEIFGLRIVTCLNWIEYSIHNENCLLSFFIRLKLGAKPAEVHHLTWNKKRTWKSENGRDYYGSAENTCSCGIVYLPMHVIKVLLFMEQFRANWNEKTKRWTGRMNKENENDAKPSNFFVSVFISFNSQKPVQCCFCFVCTLRCHFICSGPYLLLFRTTNPIVYNKCVGCVVSYRLIRFDRCGRNQSTDSSSLNYYYKCKRFRQYVSSVFISVCMFSSSFFVWLQLLLFGWFKTSCTIPYLEYGEPSCSKFIVDAFAYYVL